MPIDVRPDLARAAAGAALLWVSGFGALTTFSLVGKYPRDVPGLFDYWSATVGDGLLLPVSLACLLVARAGLPSRAGDEVLFWLGFASGCLMGLCTQISWLMDSDPVRNWTLPQPHRFNAAGYYHAAFLILACGVFAAYWASTAYRVARAGRTKSALRRVAWPLATAIATGVGFAGLLLIDNAAPRTATSSAATVIATGAGLALLGSVLLLALLLARRHLRRPVLAPCLKKLNHAEDGTGDRQQRSA